MRNDHKSGHETDEDYLRAAEVAKIFHVSPKTVSRWADEGRLPYTLTLGGHRRFPRKAIEELLSRSHPEPPVAH